MPCRSASTRRRIPTDLRRRRGDSAFLRWRSTWRTSPSRSASACSICCATAMSDPGLARRPAGDGHRHRGGAASTRSRSCGKSIDDVQDRPDRHRGGQRGGLPAAACGRRRAGPRSSPATARASCTRTEGSSSAQDRVRRQVAVCQESNDERRARQIAEALRGADVCIAFASPGPGTIEPAWVQGDGRRRRRLRLRQPDPRRSGPGRRRRPGHASWRTGRSDFPNQVNNSLGFPGIFRGVLDVRARSITDEMALAAADVLAGYRSDAVVSNTVCSRQWPSGRSSRRIRGRDRGRSATAGTRPPRHDSRGAGRTCSTHDPRRATRHGASGRRRDHPAATALIVHGRARSEPGVSPKPTMDTSIRGRRAALVPTKSAVRARDIDRAAIADRVICQS